MKFMSSVLVFACFVSVWSDAYGLTTADPGVVPVQSISDHRLRDAVTGRFIKDVGTGGNLPTVVNTQNSLPVPTTGTQIVRTGSNLPVAQTGSNLPVAQTGSNLPVVKTNPGTLSPVKTAPSGNVIDVEWTSKPVNDVKQLPAGTNNSNPATGATKTAGKVTANTVGKVAGGALAVVGMAAGAYGMYESVASTDKTTWQNVADGALSGAGFAASAAAFVNLLPIGGQVAYGGVIAVGTVVGAMGAGAELFSETDCEIDPVLGKEACCNISKLTNIDAYRAEIGDTMFTDTFPYVRYCVQGKKEFKEEQPWLKGRFLDDHWSSKAEKKLCPGYVEPANPDMQIQLYGAHDASVGYCWAWECADEGMIRSGAYCFPKDNGDGEFVGPVLPTKPGNSASTDAGNGTGEVGKECAASDLPQYAVAGVYVMSGDKIVCAATDCKENTYLVLNDKGISQGWCVASSYCKDGTQLNVIDGNKTDLKCIGSQAAGQEAVQSESANENQQEQQVQQQNQQVQQQQELLLQQQQLQQELLLQQQQEQQLQAELNALQTKVSEQVAVIERIEKNHENEKPSVWKNEKGEFNTSRLLSDSIAGVALGTVGGLVVNKVVKDKHVETGFEEIGCSVDNRVIAEFGDSFVISGANDKQGCIGNNLGYGNAYVWASRRNDGTEYFRMTEDVDTPENNICWIRVDVVSSNPKINVSDVKPRWFPVGQQVVCGSWADKDTLKARALKARKGARTLATIGAAVGGAGIGVGMMELFGNRLIGGKVMGQKSLDEVQLLYSQMSDSEKIQYEAALKNLKSLCDDLHAKGLENPACGD